jgi:hypothetical protein
MKAGLVALFVLFSLPLLAQEPVQQEGEFGIGLGASHYFGDLNSKPQFNRPKVAANIFFRKNFGNYIAARVNASYAQLGYSDKYNTHNEYQRRRNLSFNANVFELALQGDFNFYKFLPGDPDFRFTPYVTLGVGIFNYDPYAFLGDEKYRLRELGTEGQGSSLHPDRKPYKSMAFSIPLGVGVKYALNDRLNIGFELLNRFTTTDYLDDVSTTYADPAAFPANPDGTPSPAFLLQDRSYDTGVPIGGKGVQRGNSKQKDQFVTATFFVSFNLQSYRCPTSK